MDFEKVNNLEERIIEGEQIKDLLEILAMDYFDKTIKEDSLIIYNYKAFHQMYGSLLNTIISRIVSLLENLKNNHDAMYKDFLESCDR